MTLEERIEALESIILHGGYTTGNYMMVGPRDHTSPIKHYMGKTEDDGLYQFFQERSPGQGTDYWGGLQTFRRFDHANPAKGYGFHPLRLWGKLFQIEANGNLVARNMVVERIYLQHPLHMNPATGNYERPAEYDEKGVPRAADGTELGGIQTAYDDVEIYIERDGDSVVLVNHGVRTVLA